MTRKEFIRRKINDYRGEMLRGFIFDNADVPYILYDYDEATDSLVAGGVSVPFHYGLEEINIRLLDERLDELEDLVIKHYKDDLGIVLGNYIPVGSKNM